MDELQKIFSERVCTAREDGYSMEFITQEPVRDEHGNLIGIRDANPARVNIYTGV